MRIVPCPLVMILKISDAVSTKAYLIWKEYRYCTTNYRHKVSLAGQSAGFRPCTFCKWYMYSNYVYSCSNLQMVIRVTFSSVALCLMLTHWFSPRRPSIQFSSSDVWMDLSFPHLTTKVLNVPVPPSPRSIAANTLLFGWRRCGNVSWQRRTALRPLSFAQPYDMHARQFDKRIL